MNQLPKAAHHFVAGVIAIGLALFAVCLPAAKFDQPVLFLALLVLSSMSASLANESRARPKVLGSSTTDITTSIQNSESGIQNSITHARFHILTSKFLKADRYHVADHDRAGAAGVDMICRYGAFGFPNAAILLTGPAPAFVSRTP